MSKLLIAVLFLVLGYFAFFKRTEPPKEVFVKEGQIEESTITHGVPVSTATPRAIVSAPVSATIVLSGTNGVVGEEGSLSDESDSAVELVTAKDERKENVDQTVVGNEKRLAEAKSAQEVFELLRKLRIRPRKLSDISKEATAKDYSKFWGSYEGSAVNNRNEVIYSLKIELKPTANGEKQNVVGKYQLSKPGKAPTTYEFYNEFGAQLLGRDAIVIGSSDGQSHFQFYKLDNGYLAGNYYEKTSRRTRTYRFVLKNK